MLMVLIAIVKLQRPKTFHGIQLVQPDGDGVACLTSRKDLKHFMDWKPGGIA